MSTLNANLSEEERTAVGGLALGAGAVLGDEHVGALGHALVAVRPEVRAAHRRVHGRRSGTVARCKGGTPLIGNESAVAGPDVLPWRSEN